MTVWPAFTLTAVTVPDTAKFRLAWLAGSSVPELATVCWMVPVVTGTVTVVMERPAGVEELEVSQRVSPTAAAMTTTATPRWASGTGAKRMPSRAQNVLVIEGQFLGEVHWVLRQASIAPAFTMFPVQSTISRQAEPQL